MRRSILLSAAPIGLAAAFALACSDTIVEPAADAPRVAFDKGGQGNGTVFVMLTDEGVPFCWSTNDEDGDSCASCLPGIVSENTFDNNDFVKLGPDGDPVTFVRGEVEIYFWEDERLPGQAPDWFGLGQGHLKWERDADTGENISFRSHETGTVSPWAGWPTGADEAGDGETRQAICHAVIEPPKGKRIVEHKVVG